MTNNQPPKPEKLRFTEAVYRRVDGLAPDYKNTAQWAFQKADNEDATELSGTRFFAWGTLNQAKAMLKATGASGLWAILP